MESVRTLNVEEGEQNYLSYTSTVGCQSLLILYHNVYFSSIKYSEHDSFITMEERGVVICQSVTKKKLTDLMIQ